jgi:hypothetical protein
MRHRWRRLRALVSTAKSQLRLFFGNSVKVVLHYHATCISSRNIRRAIALHQGSRRHHTHQPKSYPPINDRLRIVIGPPDRSSLEGGRATRDRFQLLSWRLFMGATGEAADMYISPKASMARQREAQKARDNRAEIVKALSHGQITRRDLFKWGIFTATGARP